jgi:hypothetical protein
MYLTGFVELENATSVSLHFELAQDCGVVHSLPPNEKQCFINKAQKERLKVIALAGFLCG